MAVQDVPVAEGVARINFRLPTDIKDVIERAAIASGQSITDFAIQTLVQTAHEVLERQQVRTLSDRDRDIFLAMLDDETEPNEALRRAFAAREQLLAK